MKEEDKKQNIKDKEEDVSLNEEELNEVSGGARAPYGSNQYSVEGMLGIKNKRNPRQKRPDHLLGM